MQGGGKRKTSFYEVILPRHAQDTIEQLTTVCVTGLCKLSLVRIIDLPCNTKP